MATLPKLVTALQEVDGRERKTIEHVGRIVREAGYIEKGKTGGGAPHMDFREAACMLIALNGAESPKDAPKSIQKFGMLVPRGHSDVSEMDEFFKDIVGAPNFLEALVELICGVPELVQASCDYLGDAFDSESEEQRLTIVNSMLQRHGPLNVDVTLMGFYAKIEIANPSLMKTFFKCEFFPNDELRETGIYQRNQVSDRRWSCTFAFPTLANVYSCLMEGVVPKADIPET